MKTEELIEALAADTRLNPPRMTVRLLAGLVASVVLIALFWSVRPDLPEILSDPLVAAKFALPLGLALLIILLWPEPGSGRALWPLALPALIAAGLFLGFMPRENLAPAVMGSSWRVCLTSIPFLSLLPGVAIFAALRRTVITHPERAGLKAGLLAGAFGAAIYALHCNEDAPVFYTVWYSLGILICGAIGRFAGRRVLGV